MMNYQKNEQMGKLNDQVVKLISIIVPVYKVETYLDKCVQSIVDQTYTNLEIILVDDGSPDNCPAMCDAWAKRDSRIKVVHKENGGLSDARNAGMDILSGDYIAFIDSDDYIAPEMLALLYAALQADDSDIAACSVMKVYEDDTPPSMLTVSDNCILDRQEAQRELLTERKLKQPVWYKLYKKHTICDIRFELGKCNEDVFWSYRAVGNARRVSLIDYVGYYYVQRSESIMGSRYSLARLDALEAIERRYQYIKGSFPGLEKEARISILTAGIYHGQMALKYLSPVDRRAAMERINAVVRRYEYKHHDYADRKLSHRIWLDIARVSLSAVCRLKNLAGVGI